MRDALGALNGAIHRGFRYVPGSTENWTPLARIWKARSGVCQDFAHLMISVLRTSGLPARYVCGYIETDPPKGGRRLVGSVATHAWVEVLVPGMEWVALDPTNDQWCGERHVAVSFGRDFADATPLRGMFKGSGGQQMTVKVVMKRAS
jgi:transglutaminase-like putative cysteine protease